MEFMVGKPKNTNVGELRGTRFTPVCTVSVTTVEGFTVDCTLWARQTRDKDTGDLSVNISAGLPRDVGTSSDDVRDEINALILENAQAYIGYPALEQAAIERVTGQRKTATAAAGRIVFTGKTLAERLAKPEAPKPPTE